MALFRLKPHAGKGTGRWNRTSECYLLSGCLTGAALLSHYASHQRAVYSKVFTTNLTANNAVLFIKSILGRLYFFLDQALHAGGIAFEFPKLRDYFIRR